MPSDTFWSNTTRVPVPGPGTPAVPVIEGPAVRPTPTPANPNPVDSSYYVDPASNELLDPAHRHIPGTAKGAIPADYITAARVVYPRYDGLSQATQLPDNRPPELDGTGAPAAVDLATFAGWHSGFQAEYLTRRGTSLAFLPTATSPLTSAQAVFLLGGDGRVYNLVSMTVSDYAKLPDADKTDFQLDLIRYGVAGRLGLSATGGSLRGLIDAQITRIDTSSLDQGDQDTFLAQLRLIRDQLSPINGLFAEDAITLKVNDIAERFDRAKAFWDAPDAQFPSTGTRAEILRSVNYFAKTNSYSSEGNIPVADTAVNKGFQEFMRAERAILTAENRRTGLVGATFGFDPKLDVPNLIYQLQLTYESQSEGVADSGTELIRQLHTLLQDYGIMQRIVNDQIKEYNPDEPESTEPFKALSSFSNKDHYVLSMFARDRAANPKADHPIEAYYDIERARQSKDFYTRFPGIFLVPPSVIPLEERKTVWDQYSTQLADTVTLLNQRNQILQNEIENATKQQNRHFELGNNALRKMNDMIMTIGRM
jgi:hypothetical protein